MFNSIWTLLGYDLEDSDSSKTIDSQKQNNSKKIILTNSFKTESDPKNFYFLSLINEDDHKWSIHGLWPQYTLTKYPRFCKNKKFDINKLDSIMDNLKKDWYSNRGPDVTFWEHEYLKHGTCNFNNLDEFNYFKTTLYLFEKAMSLKLPELYFNPENGKCLIPVDQNLNFFKIKS